MPTIQRNVAVNNTRLGSYLDGVLAKELHPAATTGLNKFVSLLAGANAMIHAKAASVGTVLGAPVGPVDFGNDSDRGGFSQRFQNGIVYLLPPAAPCWVHGAILDKYLAIGGEKSVLGYPITDERTTPDGIGRYVHFQDGSIYWTYATGAQVVRGEIRNKWAALGWERGWLGYPTSDEIGFTEDGRISQFQNGNIYFWPDTGAIELGNVAVRYRGLYCFGESNEWSSADEPYVVLGTVAVPNTPPLTVRSRVYDDVDSGNARPDLITLYTGQPLGLTVTYDLFERDEGDPDAYLSLVKTGVELSGKGVAAGCVELFGPEAAKTCESIWSAIGPALSKFLNGQLGTDDDHIDAGWWTLSAKEMVTMAGAPHQNQWGVEYQWASKLLSDGDASYAVYLDIVRV
jgi:hypothetical protein